MTGKRPLILEAPSIVSEKKRIVLLSAEGEKKGGRESGKNELTEETS